MTLHRHARWSENTYCMVLHSRRGVQQDLGLRGRGVGRVPCDFWYDGYDFCRMQYCVHRSHLYHL